MMRALYSSVAGLKTHQTKMDVIGNNIANVNTVGFKSTRVTFSTMMYQRLSSASGANSSTGTGGVNAKQIGLGSNFASTTVSIATGGATESTGNAFDLKIADTSTTSFFIVSNGTENVFTRAGAFYVDGAGNLCMESTGYTVMGWQVDADGNIIKDTVSPLKIMSASNQTSQPEYTTKAIVKGILDDNSSNVNMDTGYAMNLNFFDNLGYPYVARFATTRSTTQDGVYNINLTDIIDSNGKSILTSDTKLADLFGTGNSGNQQGSNINITDNYTMVPGMQNALKQLAETPTTATIGTDADQTVRVYTYNAADINEYFGLSEYISPDAETDSSYTVEDWSLPAGYKVINTVKYDSEKDEETAGAITILDAEGNDVTKQYTSGTTAEDGLIHPLLNEAGDEFNISWSPKRMVALWVYKSQLVLENDASATGSGTNKIGQLSQSQVAQLQQFPGLESISTSGKVMVKQNIEGNKTTYTFAPESSQSANAADVAKIEANPSKSYLISDPDIYNKGYLTVTGDKLGKIFTTNVPADAELRYVVGDGSYSIVTPSSDGFKIQFSLADGSLVYVGQDGSTSQKLKLSSVFQDGNFQDIDIDFSALKNLANNGSSTAAISSGDSEGNGTGKKVGNMTGLSVDTSGKVFGTYSNGNTVLLGQIAVARFANASGLESIGDNCFKTTLNSGEFDGIGEEITSDGSTMSTGELEMSNVDLATEFTQMITTQRGYQANSRVISTSDSILEELVNLKR